VFWISRLQQFFIKLLSIVIFFYWSKKKCAVFEIPKPLAEQYNRSSGPRHTPANLIMLIKKPIILFFLSTGIWFTGKCNTRKWSSGKWYAGKWKYGESYDSLSGKCNTGRCDSGKCDSRKCDLRKCVFGEMCIRGNCLRGNGPRGNAIRGNCPRGKKIRGIVWFSKIRMRRNLQNQPKILKKNSEHRIYQSKQKFSLKNYDLYL
jgi:hypothetical protein